MLPQHPSMSSAFPYMLKARVHLINALYAWIADNGMTPHILVDTTVEGVRIPPGIDKDGKVVLNISMLSTSHLVINEDSISFGGTFGGRHASIYLPMVSVLAIYARESGVGMGFPGEESSNQPVSLVEEVPPKAPEELKPTLASVSTDQPAAKPVPTTGKRDRSHLSVIK